jgi:hypothetical protein
MKTERLYLVRRDHREFIGPMGVEEFQRRLERMEFGLQDEVAGHCGPWIVLDHKQDITRYYPELAAALGLSLSLSWREVTGHARVISKQDVHQDRKRPSRKQKVKAEDRKGYQDFILQQKRKSSRMYAGAILTLVLAAGAAIWIVQRRDDVPITADYTALMAKTDPNEFLTAMGLKIIPSPQKYLKTPAHQAQWLPLFRMYAFYTTGVIEGVSSKLLRGDLPAAAPLDCSVETWKQRLREQQSQVTQFIQGKSLVKNPWTKLLSIDPHWVRRRPAKGWAKPKNYYEGCLMTASVAARSIASEGMSVGDVKSIGLSEVLPGISLRLAQQLEIITSGRAVTVLDKESFLGRLTCLETASQLQVLDECRTFGEGIMKSLLEEKYALGLMRLGMQQAGVIDAKVVATLGTLQGRLGFEDQMSRFDLTPEHRMIGYLVNGMAVDQAVGKVIEEFSEVVFK